MQFYLGFQIKVCLFLYEHFAMILFDTRGDLITTFDEEFIRAIPKYLGTGGLLFI